MSFMMCISGDVSMGPVCYLQGYFNLVFWQTLEIRVKMGKFVLNTAVVYLLSFKKFKYRSGFLLFPVIQESVHPQVVTGPEASY